MRVSLFGRKYIKLTVSIGKRNNGTRFKENSFVIIAGWNIHYN